MFYSLLSMHIRSTMNALEEYVRDGRSVLVTIISGGLHPVLLLINVNEKIRIDVYLTVFVGTQFSVVPTKLEKVRLQRTQEIDVRIDFLELLVGRPCYQVLHVKIQISRPLLNDGQVLVKELEPSARLRQGIIAGIYETPIRFPVRSQVSAIELQSMTELKSLLSHLTYSIFVKKKLIGKYIVKEVCTFIMRALMASSVSALPTDGIGMQYPNIARRPPFRRTLCTSE